MKKKFLSSSMDLIKRNGKYNDEQLEVIAYGLEGVSLTVTKLIILFVNYFIYCEILNI